MDTSSGESTPTKQNRSSTGRAALPRRSTRGPLDISQGPVSSTSSPSSSQILPRPTSPRPPVALSTYTTAQPYPSKEFHKLLRPEIYHPLTHLTTPAPFRSSSTQPSPDTPLPSLLATGHFRAAAIAAAQLLTTSTSPSDHATIFSLLYTRLACLTLCGSTALAAQEATALEDLNSSAYRDEATGSHLAPWELRVLAVRLQGVGFNDPRKIIMGYYDLARQARLEIARLDGNNAHALFDEPERRLWETRLADLGIRVASALVEMGDLEGATYHLRKLSSSDSSSSSRRRRDSTTSQPPPLLDLSLQKALLWLRIGDLSAARACCSQPTSRTTSITQEGPKIDTDGIITALSAIAEGAYPDAVHAWQQLCAHDPQNGLYRQNLAVCLLYAGRMDEARTQLESLVSAEATGATEGHASDDDSSDEQQEYRHRHSQQQQHFHFHALTFNLSTIYELCTDRSRAYKLALAERVAALGDEDGLGWEKSVVDFKL